MIISVYCLVLLILFVNCDFSERKPFDTEDDLLVTLNKPRSRIRGHILKSYEGRDFYAFQDIPYAVPPVGKLRFREALPHPGWEGILNTTTNSKVCVQFGTGQEDCLILNVFTPAAQGIGKLPVFVWIHGGAFLAGQCNLKTCGPHYFMDHRIIVVTLHYRVGPFGFLTTEDGVIPGNIGLKDQLLALKWVNKNIAVFGGDPTKVTIGGQSAGSISVSSHVISQKATGLFRAAIMESGTALVHGSYISTARDYAFQVGKILQPDFNNSSTHDLLRILQKASAREILTAAFEIQPKVHPVGLLPDLLWALVVEKQGENSYLTVPFHQSVLEGKFDKVPILTGFTSEEILSFIDNVDGCAHSEELAYMWPQEKLVSPADRHMSKIMVQLWTNFIKTLNPTPDSFDPILRNFHWPKVKDVENLEFVNINNTLRLERGPKRYKAVKELYEKYVNPPYFVF